MPDAKNETGKGWSWFDTPQNSEDDVGGGAGLPDPGRELRVAYARCFAGVDGKKVIDHLRSLTLERTLGPDASAQMLRHMEGQRQLVVYILAQSERGRLGS